MSPTEVHSIRIGVRETLTGIRPSLTRVTVPRTEVLLSRTKVRIIRIEALGALPEVRSAPTHIRPGLFGISPPGRRSKQEIYGKDKSTEEPEVYIHEESYDLLPRWCKITFAFLDRLTLWPHQDVQAKAIPDKKHASPKVPF